MPRYRRFVAFPRKLLNDGEQVILDLVPHWSTLALPVGVLVVVLVAVIAWVALRVARRQTTNLVLTTDRLIRRAGIVAKRGKEIPLERINDISYHQSVFERLIGTGDLSIESAGARSRETFGDIPRPAVVQNEIYRQMEACAMRRTDRAVAPRDLSVPEQLEKLDDLRQRGIITWAEFDAKKQQLLDRL